MSKRSKKDAPLSASVPKQPEQQPKSLPIAARGIKTGSDFAKLMSAMMTDLIEGSITPAVGNAACNAGGKLLKVVEMQYKYGTQSPSSNVRILELTASSEPEPAALPK